MIMINTYTKDDYMNKKYKVSIGLMLILTILITGCNKSTPENPDPNVPPGKVDEDDLSEVDKIKVMIEAMTLEEKIGQLLIVGLEGTNISQRDIDQMEINKVGGFILFSRNIENKSQVIGLLNSLKSNNNNDIPLFLSVDEEGGIVSRLKNIYKNLPNAAVLGKMDDEQLSFDYGEVQGLKLKSLGFNLNFAPVMDINSNPDNPVIGNRAFGSVPDVVLRHGRAVSKGMEAQGIIPAIKHFPGHGDTKTDSHISLPIVDKDYGEIMQMELVPFKEMSDEADMIMIGHLLFPKIDSEYPATMSSNIINEILREDLGYDGVIVTDDITMGAIVQNYSIEDAAVKFLSAGGDILLVCHGEENPDIIINRIKEAIQSDELNMEDIEEKVYRILTLKDKYHISDELIDTKDDFQLDEKINQLLNNLK